MKKNVKLKKYICNSCTHEFQIYFANFMYVVTKFMEA